MSDDMAMQNFMMNTLRGEGTGGGIGGGGSNPEFALLSDMELKPDKEISASAFNFFKKFFAAMQGFSQTMGLEGLGIASGQLSPPSTPIANAKLGNMLGRK